LTCIELYRFVLQCIELHWSHTESVLCFIEAILFVYLIVFAFLFELCVCVYLVSLNNTVELGCTFWNCLILCIYMLCLCLFLHVLVCNRVVLTVCIELYWTVIEIVLICVFESVGSSLNMYWDRVGLVLNCIELHCRKVIVSCVVLCLCCT
jgi:hypothetical protein